jgi:glycosyltransferase involved in cell wall biosynthesis
MRPRVSIDMRRADWRPEVGISRYSTMLVQSMAASATRPVDLELLRLASHALVPGTTTQVVGKGHHLAARFGQEQFRIAAHSRRSDLLHLPWYEGPALARCPIVLNVHDLDTLEPSGGYSRRFRAYYNALLRLYIRTAKRIIVPSLASLDAVERRWPGRPYVHIPYGIDATAFGRAAQSARAEAPTVLYSGGYGARKRVPDLLQAFASVAKRAPEARLVMTGVPPAPILAEIRSLHCAEKIKHVGIVSLDQLIELYARAWVVAYPSALEGFGFPVLEAFASGTPVVSTQSGSIPEIAGGAALLVPAGDPPALADALLVALTDDELADRLSVDGRARASDFGWDRTVERTLETYADALAENTVGD